MSVQRFLLKSILSCLVFPLNVKKEKFDLKLHNKERDEFMLRQEAILLKNMVF